MYQSIASEYSSLFPLDPDRIAMTERLIGVQDSRALSRDRTRPGTSSSAGKLKVLDIGCASGDFPIALALAGFDAEGWEPEPALYNTARVNHEHALRGEASGGLQFFQKGMLDLDAAEKYSLISCMGNTLPHLRDPGEIDEFLKRAYQALSPGGSLVLQLLNYRRILEQGAWKFPEIETGTIIFRRRYRDISSELVRFEIEIQSKSENSVYQDSSNLFPITDAVLIQLLGKNGFSSIQRCRNYQLEAASDDDAFFIITARKGK